MSIFSVFSRSGSQPQDQQNSQSAQAGQQNSIAAATAVDSTTLLNDQQVESNAKSYYQTSPSPSPSPSSPHSPSSLAIDQVQGGVSEFLSQVDFSSSQFNPVASPAGIEYLNLEEGPIYTGGVMPSRGWSDDLCYGTGTMYILGLGTGGAWGFIEGMRSQHGSNFKLRLNSVLNSMTRRGPFVGNSMGVLGMFYNSLNSAISSYRGTRDQYNSIGAAAISGVLFKITAGPRASIISGIICAGAVGAYQASVLAYSRLQEKSVSGVALSSPSEPQLSKAAVM
ncbi:Mitochondrial import inner membrane translocase subunit tim23 [Dipsacomyces acuminosporus]|nr:Mitochondrial import inner membrane translocase subunit tim23 [Dipsacomyces acuminosporus]